MGQGSGSVTTFSRADGFTTIDRHEEIVPAGTMISVQLLGRELQLADLVVIGSHCIGLDYLLSELQMNGVRSKFLAVGSLAGLEAAKRGECDIAGIHLLDPQSGEYNRPFLTPALTLIPGYGRLQGIVFRKGDARFEGRTATDAIAAAMADPSCVMVNRNQGSGTRALIDRLLGESEAAGYAVQPRNHNAVAAAVVQGRADWGVTLDTIARTAGLGFIPCSTSSTTSSYDGACGGGRHRIPRAARRSGDSRSWSSGMSRELLPGCSSLQFLGPVEHGSGSAGSVELSRPSAPRGTPITSSRPFGRMSYSL